MNNFSRATSAFVLTASLLVSSVAAVAQTSTTKQSDPAAKTSQTATEQKAEQKPAQKKTQTAAATTSAKSNKALSTNEDPNMIGKRNINGGLIIPKMSGSLEKEVRIGRQAAAEV